MTSTGMFTINIRMFMTGRVTRDYHVAKSLYLLTLFERTKKSPKHFRPIALYMQLV